MVPKQAKDSKIIIKGLNNQGAEYNNPVIESTKPAVYEITIRYAIPEIPNYVEAITTLTNEKTWDVFNNNTKRILSFTYFCRRTYRQLAYGPYARMVISLPTNNNTANIPFYPIRLVVQGNTEDTTDPNYNEFNPDIHVVLKVYVVTAFGYGIVENLNIMVFSIGVSKNPDWNYAGEGIYI
ncbi:hypothetical protein RIR_jg174.t1 [Rhizophagus irregularis DAOM 181602=DAOM 197198]|nr:hypothetical protein RIR_jg174.t1 [Rhizophagus irregularis DAOM 181602=DAOM 197198]